MREIKERIAALETIASLANRPTVEAYARTVLTTSSIKAIVAACETPKTKEQLRTELGFASVPALDHHLNQIRPHDILQPETNEDGKLTFRWSNLFARLPRTTLDELLGNANPKKTAKRAARQFNHAQTSK
ncbi:MAG: hypothetical protein WAL73_09720 [Terracidiphilus sp.]